MRQPDWQSDDGAIQLYCCDCLALLPEMKADAVVTDPPYGIGVNHNMGRRAGDAKSNYEPANWDLEPPSRECFDAIFECSNDQVIWGANHFIDLIGKRSPCWLVWNKLFSDKVSFASCELAWTSLDAVVRKFDCSSQRRNGLHPTQKPLALMQWCLGLLPDCHTILDPFMGSGTTGVACIRTGRKFIGIELERKYFEIAKKRIKAELAQPRLFAPEPEKQPQQLELIA